MKLNIETQAYNERRYGQPWIARVRFPTAAGEFVFGEWAGQPGTAGLLVLDAEPGDVIARGQKDFRKSANSAPVFHILQADGTLERVSKADAYRHCGQRAVDPPEAEQTPPEWHVDGDLIYRVDENGTNRDEIRVTMSDGVRFGGNCSERAKQIARWLNAGSSRPDTGTAEATEALRRCQRLFDEALPKFDWGKSALDANAIALLNEVPAEVRAALRAMSSGDDDV